MTLDIINLSKQISAGIKAGKKVATNASKRIPDIQKEIAKKGEEFAKDAFEAMSDNPMAHRIKEKLGLDQKLSLPVYRKDTTGKDKTILERKETQPAKNFQNNSETICRIQSQFADRFKHLANRPEAFNRLLQKVYGPKMDSSKAEALRQKAQKGDFSWLPKIEVKSKETMNNGLGAYDAKRDVVYLNESIMNDPNQAMAVYAEEIGHSLDKRFKKSDTRGDEGEMFGRLFMGEKLSNREMNRIRNENDHGVVNVNGRQVDVEFSWLTDAVKNVSKEVERTVKNVGKEVERTVKNVGKGVTKIAKGVGKVFNGVWDGVKKVMSSKVFQGILTVAQFIPQLAPFAKLAQIASAGLQAYNGIKNGNLMQAAMGVIGGATGLGKSANMLGLGSKATNLMNKVSSYGQFGLSAYQAAKSGKFEDLALAMIGKIAPNAPMGHIKDAIDIYQKAHIIKNCVARGDELAALNAFTSMAGGYVNNNSKLDKTLHTLNKIGGDVHAVESAIKKKDWTKLSDLVMHDVKKYTGLNDNDLKNTYNALRVATSAANIDKRLKAGDWIGAGLSVAEAGHRLSDNEVTRNTLAAVSSNLHETREVFNALQNHEYDKAFDKFNKMLGSPLLIKQGLAMANGAQQNIDAIKKSINTKDYDRATKQIIESFGKQMPLEKNVGEKVRRTLDLAKTVSDIVTTVKNDDPSDVIIKINKGKLAPQSTMNKDFGENLELLQGIRTALHSGSYPEAIASANELLGKSWGAEQWLHELNNSIDALGKVEHAVDRHDWQQAANLAMETLANYLNISEDTSADVHRLVKLFSAFEKQL